MKIYTYVSANKSAREGGGEGELIFKTAPFYLLSSVYDTLHAIYTDNMYIIGGGKWCEVTVKGGSIL